MWSTGHRREPPMFWRLNGIKLKKRVWWDCSSISAGDEGDFRSACTSPGQIKTLSKSNRPDHDAASTKSIALRNPRTKIC